MLEPSVGVTPFRLLPSPFSPVTVTTSPDAEAINSGSLVAPEIAPAIIHAAVALSVVQVISAIMAVPATEHKNVPV